MKGKLKSIICLLVIASAVYVAYQYVMPQYRYRVFESEARDIIRFKGYKEKDFRDDLMRAAEDTGIPVTAQDIVVDSDWDGNYHAIVVWRETFSILSLYSKRFDFTVEVSSKGKN